jgi:hypothetical protein
MWPSEYSGKLYGIDAASSSQAFRRMAADGTIEASSAPFAGSVWKVVYDGAGIAYAISTETGPDGFINACKVSRIDMSTLAVTATIDLFASFSQVGYSIAWDGSALWSATIQGATLRKHNVSTLAVTDTEVLNNTATRTIHLSSNGSGTLFAVGKDWSKIVSFDAASSGINWTVDYAADAATFDSAVYAGSLLFAAGGGAVFAINPATGAVVQEHESAALNAICEYDGNAAYATSLTTIDPATSTTIVLAGPVNVLDGTTGALTESFPLESDFVRLSGTVGGKLLVVSVNNSPGGSPYYGHIYGPAPDLPGGTVKIYQMSSIVGRGYPATITI